LVDTGKPTKRVILHKLLMICYTKGSTLVFLPRDIINSLFSGIRGLRRDYSGQYIVPCNSPNLPDIVITMNQHDYVLKPDHYVIKSGAVSNMLVHFQTI
jgi:hypothetical protein